MNGFAEAEALVDVLHQHVESQPGPRIQLLCDDKLTDPRASELSCHPGTTVVECIRTPCNLYKVSRTDYSMYSWDEYQSFICVAATEQEARHMHPDNRSRWDEEEQCWFARYDDCVRCAAVCAEWRVNVKDLDVALIGLAYPHLEGVVHTDFKHG